MMFGWLRRRRRVVHRAWYGPVCKPYAVGPGAPVGPMNPHPPVPAVDPGALGPLRPSGVARWEPPPYVNGTYAQKRAAAKEDRKDGQ